MGTDKALLPFGGERLVVRGLRTLGEVCDEVAIAGGSPELMPFGRVVADGVPGCGPLGGIVAALEQSSSEWNLFLAVDLPLVPAAALERLLSMASGSSSVCLMARVAGRPQPLCGLYSRRGLPALREELVAGRLKVLGAAAAAGINKMVDFEDESWFLNLNTPEEFAEAERHMGGLDTSSAQAHLMGE